MQDLQRPEVRSGCVIVSSCSTSSLGPVVRGPSESSALHPGDAVDSKAQCCSLLLVESSRLLADALGVVLASRGWVSNMRTVLCTRDAVEALRSSPPDLVLVSVAGDDSFESLSTLRACDPERRIIAFSVPDDEDAIIRCAGLGVAGLLPLTGTVDDLETIVANVMRGETAVTPRVAAALLRHVASLASERLSDAATGEEHLTPREREVLTLVELGWTNKQIAQQLRIEVRTVKNHVHNLLEKLRVSRRGEAAAKLRSRVDLRSGYQTGPPGVPAVRSLGTGPDPVLRT
ncbi:LuxR C-terminal-related transcriptional regulator [Agrococcus sp. DT81.2]|uniref:LuxR C-terminal-related transcriptional regulator n=1 Tax=Agrococcus sp. DT81.2 TaxID=3393414 RepID=UPI003CE4A720